MKYSNSIWIGLIIIGSALCFFPAITGEKAYFVGEDYYLNIKDSVDLSYGPFVESQIQQKLNIQANAEKKAFRDSLKSYADSLEVVWMDLLDKRNKAVKLEKVKIEREALNRRIQDREYSIDEKFDAMQLSSKEKNQMASKIIEEISLEKFVVLLANDSKNPDKDPSVSAVTIDDIKIKTVKQQPFGPFLLAGLIMILCAAFVLYYNEGKINLSSKQTTLLYSSGFGALSIIAFIMLYSALGSKVSFEKELKERESKVIAQLSEIRKAQLNYFEAKGKYANNWEDLNRFLKNDSITVIKQLVNPDDSVAVKQAELKGLPIREEKKVSAYEKTFGSSLINIDQLSIIPFTDEEFEINSGRINRGGRDVFVFEVSTSRYEFVKDLSNCPENFDKSSALVLGSMREPTTEGNW